MCANTIDLYHRQKRLEWESMQEKSKLAKSSTRSGSSTDRAVPESPQAGARKKPTIRIPAYLKKRMLARADSGDNLVSLCNVPLLCSISVMESSTGFNVTSDSNNWFPMML